MGTVCAKRKCARKIAAFPYEHKRQMLYLHDHKGITVLQKLLV